MHQLRRLRARMPESGYFAGHGDLRDRSVEVHRVRRPFRQAAMPRGVPGRLHSGQPGIRRDARAAPTEVRSADAREGLAVRGERQGLGRFDQQVHRACLLPQPVTLRVERLARLLELQDAVLELVARTVNALDAVETASKLEVMLAHLRLER